MKCLRIFAGLLLLLVVITLMGSCSSARKSPPIEDPLPLEEDRVQKGQIHFMAHCHKCHPGGEAGLGPAINSNPAPKFLKRFQVRHGLGAMPSFSEDEISEEDLDNIIAYLQALRRN